MVTIQYRKEKCDNCGKIVEMDNKKHETQPPMGWFEVTVYRWGEKSGTSQFYREVCSMKCLKKVMNEFKEFDKEELMVF